MEKSNSSLKYEINKELSDYRKIIATDDIKKGEEILKSD